MANMSYCKFENTYQDLQDCHDKMESAESVREKGYRDRLIKLCGEIHGEYGEWGKDEFADIDCDDEGDED